MALVFAGSVRASRLGRESAVHSLSGHESKGSELIAWLVSLSSQAISFLYRSGTHSILCGADELLLSRYHPLSAKY